MLSLIKKKKKMIIFVLLMNIIVGGSVLGLMFYLFNDIYENIYPLIIIDNKKITKKHYSIKLNDLSYQKNETFLEANFNICNKQKNCYHIFAKKEKEKWKIEEIKKISYNLI